MRGGNRKARAQATVNVSIDVPDLEAGLRFYASVFGFVETARPFPTMAIVDANAALTCPVTGTPR
jgi:catechol 2,3-dioxygenase-like lactoylglutathione lyase family enzyme